MSAHVRKLHGWLSPKALLAIAFAFATVLGVSAFAPASAFATEKAGGLEVAVGDGVVLATSVDEEGVLRVDRVIVEGAAACSIGDDGVASGNVVLSPDEAADVIDLQSEEVLLALAAVHNGWYQSNTGDWFYFVNGSWVTGWYKVDGYWYCFKDNGIMRTGWYSDGSYWFYLRPSNGDPTSGPKGSMVTGWASIDGYWYYLDLEDGNMRHGWIFLSSSRYYLRTATDVPCSGPEGAMVIDWAKIGYEWYYFGSDGSMRTGWLPSRGYDYYLADENIDISSGNRDYGAMVKGLRTIGLYEYYFWDPSLDYRSPFTPNWPEGAMAKGVKYIELFPNDGLAVYATIDERGHVVRHQLPLPDLLQDGVNDVSGASREVPQTNGSKEEMHD